MTTMASPVYLLKGDDESLLRDATVTLVDRLVGDGDRSLMVDEHGVEEEDLAAVVDAAQTPPFLAEGRVIVAREASRFSKADDVAPVVAYLADPLPSSVMVLVWGSGRVPKSLTDAVARAGGQVVDTSAGRKPSEWVDKRLRAAAVTFSGPARSLVAERLGDDASRVLGVLAALESTYGAGASVGPEEVEPFLGHAGGVPPWELTDAIDGGRIADALDKLHRMLGGGDRHALQVMATLQGHFSRILRLEGAGVANEREAAAALGIKGSTFPAKKAMAQARRLGHDRVVRAVTLFADADLALRGAQGWPPELVMEVLVARLAGLAKR
ncbi:DNA polymerase III subunit delta [soil metagenome]